MQSETQPTDERELLEALQRLLAERLPADWAISVERGPLPDLRGLGSRPDAWLTIAPPTSLPARFLVEAKMTLYPKDASIRFGSTWAPIARARDRLGSPPGAAVFLVVSRFLAPSTRDILRRSGVSYADATGNLRLESRNPALFVELSGASSDPWKSERPLRSLKGPGTARIVRALLDYQPPFKLRDLALSADLPLATASRVVSYLVEEAIVSRDGRGPIESVAWQQLLRRWATETRSWPPIRRSSSLSLGGPEPSSSDSARSTSSMRSRAASPPNRRSGSRRRRSQACTSATSDEGPKPSRSGPRRAAGTWSWSLRRPGWPSSGPGPLDRRPMPR